MPPLQVMMSWLAEADAPLPDWLLVARAIGYPSRSAWSEPRSCERMQGTYLSCESDASEGEEGHDLGVHHLARDRE